MSLSVYLNNPKPVKKICHHCDSEYEEKEYFFEANITHNLNKMAGEAGIYEALWRPEEISVTKASELIEILETGITDMKVRPEYYEQLNSSNGWGTYEQFLPWIERYLQACKEYPDAEVSVSR